LGDVTASFITIGPFNLYVVFGRIIRSGTFNVGYLEGIPGNSSWPLLRLLQGDAIKKDPKHRKVRGAYRYENGCNLSSEFEGILSIPEFLLAVSHLVGFGFINYVRCADGLSHPGARRSEPCSALQLL